MTLHYWWMHWFWITLKIYSTVSKDISLDISLSHFILAGTEPTTSIRQDATKPIEITVNPPTTKDPPIGTNIVKKIQKASLREIDHLNTTTAKSFHINPTVIYQNSTDVSLNVTDNQVIVNTSIRPIKHTDSLLSSNDTKYNRTLCSSSEKDENNVEKIPGNLSAAGITGITLGCVVIVGIVCGVSFFLYRNRGFNRPQVLNDRCSNPDSSGYIDDASVRDNSEEMYSLDNDSFLNSIEAMTIQNYWTDTVKHTKL